MVNRGEMKLDDPVKDYLPESVRVPIHGGKQITLLNLAAQDSGLPHDADNMAPRDPNNLFAEYTAEDLYAFLSKYSLDKDPGTEFRYSNAGMSLLGHAIELKTGRDVESLVVDRICAPLGMESTRVTIPPDAKARLAIGHDERGKPQPAMTFHVVAPAGALRSTANDMLKYVSANVGLKSSTLTPLMQKMHVIRHADALVFGATAMPWYDARISTFRNGTARACRRDERFLDICRLRHQASPGRRGLIQFQCNCDPLIGSRMAHPSTCLVEKYRSCKC
jgi:CubicO group peptidase (beta-lactamase class C family)